MHDVAVPATMSGASGGECEYAAVSLSLAERRLLGRVGSNQRRRDHRFDQVGNAEGCAITQVRGFQIHFTLTDQGELALERFGEGTKEGVVCGRAREATGHTGYVRDRSSRSMIARITRAIVTITGGGERSFLRVQRSHSTTARPEPRVFTASCKQRISSYTPVPARNLTKR